MLPRVKKSQFRSRLSDNRPLQKGQAVIEYMLILVVTVSLVMLLMNYMFKPFGEFIQRYMGDYVGCLLDYGELPTLGSDEESIVDSDTECDKKFKPASIAGGRPPKEGSGGGSDSKRDPAGRGEGAEGSQGGSSGSGGDSGGGSGGSYAGSSSRGRSSRINLGRRPSRGIESGSNEVAAGKVVEITLDNGGGGGFFRSSSNNSAVVRRARKETYVGIAGLSEADRKKLEKKAEGTSRTVTVGQGMETPPKKTTIKPPEPKATVQAEDESFTIGGFIRYLFIAAIVIALVLLIGGQALQMSKEL